MQISLQDSGYVFSFHLTTIIVIFAWLRVSPRRAFLAGGFGKAQGQFGDPSKETGREEGS